MQPLPIMPSALADNIKNYFDVNKQNWNIDNVYYADQNKMVGSTCLCIEPDSYTMTDYNAAFGTGKPDATILIYVYSLGIENFSENNRVQSDGLAEVIAGKCNTTLLDDIGFTEKVNYYVRQIEYGYRVVNGTTARVSRITFVVSQKGRIR